MEVLSHYCTSLGSRMGLWHCYQCTNVGYMESDEISTVETSVLFLFPGFYSCFFWTAVLFILFDKKTQRVLPGERCAMNQWWTSSGCVCVYVPLFARFVYLHVCVPLWWVLSVSSLISHVLRLSGCESGPDPVPAGTDPFYVTWRWWRAPVCAYLCVWVSICLCLYMPLHIPDLKKTHCMLTVSSC